MEKAIVKQILQGHFDEILYHIKYKTVNKTLDDFKDRELWIEKIKCLSYKEIGSSNYSYDQVGTYQVQARINSGKGKGKMYNCGEDYIVIFEFTISEWYVPNERISITLIELFKDYPILNMQEFLHAFSYRNFYKEL